MECRDKKKYNKNVICFVFRKKRAEEHKRIQILKKMELRELKQRCLTSRKQEVVKDRRFVSDRMNDLRNKFNDELERLMHSDDVQDPDS